MIDSRRRRPHLRFAFVLLLVAMLSDGALLADDSLRPGRIVIEIGGEEMGRDRNADQGTRYWSWSWGSLVVENPDAIVEESDDRLILSYSDALRGMADARRMKLKGGRFNISTPLLLSDAEFDLFLGQGVLEIDDGEILVTQTRHRNKRAEYMFFLGVLLLTLVLLRNARRKAKRS